MSSLSDLPTEIIIKSFSFLSPKDLAPCARLSKRCLAIIRTSSILAYAMELGKAGLEETYYFNINRVECNIADLLATLRRREHGWSTVSWKEHLKISVKKRYIHTEVCGSVFTGGYAHHIGDGGIDTIDIHDFQDFGNMRTLPFDGLFSTYAIDAGQDLLVLVEKCVPGDLFCTLYLRTLSTGLEYEHTEIAQSAMTFPIPTEIHNFHQSTVKIFGDSLLFTQRAYGVDDVRIVNWKTAQFLKIHSDIQNCLCTIVSETEVVVVGREEEDLAAPIVLGYYTFGGLDSYSSNLEDSEFGDNTINEQVNDNPIKLRNYVAFEFPFENFQNASRHMVLWDAKVIFSEASLTPKSFSPFIRASTAIPPRDPRLIGVRFKTPLSYAIDIFINIALLRKLKNANSSALQHPTHKIPWEEWGPDITRALEDTCLQRWNPRCLRGYRVTGSESGRKLGFGKVPGDTILDFNVNAWNPAISGIVRDERSELASPFGLNITSSLPYKEIHIPKHESNSEYDPEYGHELMICDDIIRVDFESHEEMIGTLHVFRF